LAILSLNITCSDSLLDRVGVATDQRGYIMVDYELQTNVPAIFMQ
jgi:pyruvate/2-oxoglutarate dehydrogenase complex dihydrolipoamide dehydrogenase (E3) component